MEESLIGGAPPRLSVAVSGARHGTGLVGLRGGQLVVDATQALVSLSEDLHHLRVELAARSRR